MLGAAYPEPACRRYSALKVATVMKIWTFFLEGLLLPYTEDISLHTTSLGHPFCGLDLNPEGAFWLVHRYLVKQ